MVSLPGGIRKKSRHQMKKNYRNRGKIRLRAYLQEFKDGDQVVLKAEPAHQGGLYASRFHGNTGKIVGKQGECYYVRINDGNMAKNLLVHPVHLKAL